MLKAFSTYREQFIEGGMLYLRERFAAVGNSFSLATSVFDTFSWPSTTDGLRNLETAT
jgi:hypothetical protein